VSGSGHRWPRDDYSYAYFCIGRRRLSDQRAPACPVLGRALASTAGWKGPALQGCSDRQRGAGVGRLVSRHGRSVLRTAMSILTRTYVVDPSPSHQDDVRPAGQRRANSPRFRADTQSSQDGAREDDALSVTLQCMGVGRCVVFVAGCGECAVDRRTDAQVEQQPDHQQYQHGSKFLSSTSRGGRRWRELRKTWCRQVSVHTKEASGQR
jgi:hypothetical protein